jgi:hypothetical protein
VARKNEARRQKRIAKQKSKRLAKRSLLFQRSSKDPAVRLQQAEKWPVVKAFVAATLWQERIGNLMIARQDSGGRLVFAAFLVDVYCLGAKNAFWRAGTRADFEDMIRQMDEVRRMIPITPACLVKIVKGAVDDAQSLGFPPHPDYHHASQLLDGIDPSTCPNSFTFGKDGKPFYIQGSNESPAQVEAIMQRIHGVGGHFFVQLHGPDVEESPGMEEEFDEG